MIQEQERVAATILLAESDPGDRLLVVKAFQRACPGDTVRTVADGRQLIDYLHAEGSFADTDEAPRPDLILLDLDMPGKDGRSAISEIRADPEWRAVPVIVLTSSQEEADILRSYELGANSCIAKPIDFDGLVDVARQIGAYWFGLARIPGRPASRSVSSRHG